MIQLIILLGIISIIDFSTKKIPVVVLVVMGIVGIASSFYAKQSIISVAVALIPGIVLMAAAFLTGEQNRLWRCSCCDAYGIVCDC